MIAIRADIDGLLMEESNKTLEYTSQTSYAHMCGHDGHTATLLAAAKVLWTHREKIPTGKTVRLLFQPAEEGPGGAKPMIAEGCLDGVDEVYGFHNIPNAKNGIIRVKDGPVMAYGSKVDIKIYGRGGHGSTPHLVKDVIGAAAGIHCALHAVKSRMVESR